jgi:hypothetical protein
MPRLTTSYQAGPPVLTLALSANGSSYLLLGIVDSGADRTLLPKDVAPRIGIPEASLVENPTGANGAANTSFPTWDPPSGVTVQAHIVAFTANGPTTWGPTIPLSPQFAQNTTPLFGRADFFQAFTVTFLTDPNLGNVFNLEY